MQNPMNLFARWFTEAEATPTIEEANAMSLVTQGLDGYPKARVVLLKHYDAEGFVFFTNYESEKGQAITADPRVGISFFWPVLERQVIIKGGLLKKLQLPQMRILILALWGVAWVPWPLHKVK